MFVFFLFRKYLHQILHGEHFSGGVFGGLKWNSFWLCSSLLTLFLAKYSKLKFWSISQKAPIESFCFHLILAQGTPQKRTEKISQRGQDEGEKKIRARGVERCKNSFIIHKMEKCSNPNTQLTLIFFPSSSWPLWDVFSALLFGVPWAKIKQKQKTLMGAFWENARFLNITRKHKMLKKMHHRWRY